MMRILCRSDLGDERESMSAITVSWELARTQTHPPLEIVVAQYLPVSDQDPHAKLAVPRPSSGSRLTSKKTSPSSPVKCFGSMGPSQRRMTGWGTPSALHSQ